MDSLKKKLIEFLLSKPLDEGVSREQLRTHLGFKGARQAETLRKALRDLEREGALRREGERVFVVDSVKLGQRHGPKWIGSTLIVKEPR